MGNEDPWNPAQELKRYCIHKKQRHGIKGIMKENIKERKGAATRQFFSLCLPLFFFRRQEQSGRKGNKGRNAFPVMGFFFRRPAKVYCVASVCNASRFMKHGNGDRLEPGTGEKGIAGISG